MIKQNAINKHLLKKEHNDGDNTLDNVKIAKANISQEVIDRIADVDQEESDRITAVGLVQGNINQEVINRTNADNSINTEINTTRNRMHTFLSENEWIEIDDLLASVVINDILYIPSYELFIIAGNDSVVYTSNNGVDWIPIDVGLFGLDLYYIGYSPTRIFVGGDSNWISYSDDGGSTWTQTTAAQNDFQDMIYSQVSGGYLFAVQGSAGPNNNIYQSTDNGATWVLKYLNPIGGDIINSIAISNTTTVDPGQIVIVGNNAKTAYSINNGVSWILPTSPFSGTASINRVIFVDELTLFIAVASGTTGGIARFGGAVWTLATTPIGSNISDIAYSSSMNLLIAVSDSGVFASSSDSITWTLLPFQDTNLNKIAYSDNLNKFITSGSNGTLYHSYIGILENVLYGTFQAGGISPMYTYRAWINFDGTGTGPIEYGSGNISSIGRDSTGQYTINFLIPMIDSNYSVSGTCIDNNVSIIELNKSYVKIETYNSSGTNIDALKTCILILR